MAASHVKALFKVLSVPGSSHISLAVHKHTGVQKFIDCCSDTSQMALVSPAAHHDCIAISLPPVAGRCILCVFSPNTDSYKHVTSQKGSARHNSSALPGFINL